MICTSQPAFWRVCKIKNDGTREIKEGDSIRLCWKFSDQKSGIQDFLDDTFGRTRIIPAYADIELTLHPHPPYRNGHQESMDVGITPLSAIRAKLDNEVMTRLAPMYGLLLEPEIQFRLDSVGMFPISFLLDVIQVPPNSRPFAAPIDDSGKMDPMSRSLEYMEKMLTRNKAVRSPD